MDLIFNLFENSFLQSGMMFPLVEGKRGLVQLLSDLRLVVEWYFP